RGMTAGNVTLKNSCSRSQAALICGLRRLRVSVSVFARPKFGQVTNRVPNSDVSPGPSCRLRRREMATGAMTDKEDSMTQLRDAVVGRPQHKGSDVVAE